MLRRDDRALWVVGALLSGCISTATVGGTQDAGDAGGSADASAVDVVVAPTDVVVAPTDVVTPTDVVVAPTDVVVAPTDVVVAPTDVVVAPTDVVMPADGCVGVTEEICNNRDDDCDGMIDEGVVRSCYTGATGTQNTGPCRAGTQSCTAGAFGACVGQVIPTVETCDNIDNNCNGSVDEGLTRVCYTGPSGTSGVGLCRAGTQTCGAGSWSSTCAGEVLPVTEGCDALDNDCDGAADEPFLSSFQLNALTTTGCVVVDHLGVTGDDRGGIAISGGSVFYTGDLQTGRMPLNLSSVSALTPSRQYDALTSDLQTEQGYSLGSGTTPIPSGGGMVTSIIPIDTAGVLNTAGAITLSTAINAPSGTGIFAGYGQILIHNTTRVYRIALPSGAVTDLGAVAAPPHTACESWAYWGIAESIAGVPHLAYVNGNTVQRLRVPTGAVTTVATFTNLNDMCSFTVSPSTGRWYFHHEGSAQFGGNAETVGHCAATFITGAQLPGRGLGDACTAGAGVCARVGTVVCDTAQTGTVCGASPGPSSAEVCNNIDDDCDGMVDESLTRTCYSGPGGTMNVGLCRGGTQVCAAGAWPTVCAGEVLPRAEVCNGMDDNCNNTSDEGVCP